MNVHSILAAKGHGVVTVPMSATVSTAVEVCCQHSVGALVVSDDGTSVQGLLGERDLLRIVASRGLEAQSLTVRDVLNSTVVTCHPSDAVEHIMGVMTETRRRHLPVVDDEGVLVGIVSIGDVVKFRLDELLSENDALYGYLTHGR